MAKNCIKILYFFYHLLNISLPISVKKNRVSPERQHPKISYKHASKVLAEPKKQRTISRYFATCNAKLLNFL